MAAESGGAQNRALALSTVAFTFCFAVWTLFAIIGVPIKAQLGLTETQFGLLVATPVLTGSLTRLMLGIWTEQYGGRLVFTAQMLLTAISTWLLTRADSYPTFLVAALGVGLTLGGAPLGCTGSDDGNTISGSSASASDTDMGETTEVGGSDPGETTNTTNGSTPDPTNSGGTTYAGPDEAWSTSDPSTSWTTSGETSTGSTTTWDPTTTSGGSTYAGPDETSDTTR